MVRTTVHSTRVVHHGVHAVVLVRTVAKQNHDAPKSVKSNSIIGWLRVCV